MIKDIVNFQEFRISLKVVTLPIKIKYLKDDETGQNFIMKI